MNDIEKRYLKMYDKSLPQDEDLFETSYVNHVAWGIAATMTAVVIWFGAALVNAENQRYALLTNKCPDPVFTGEIDKRCLSLVKSRDHWWEHLWYGVTHLSPEKQVSR
jgi:hypothetical protein